MAHYPYLIVGGGMTADAAVRGIRELDAAGSIGLIGDEADPPTRGRRSPRVSGRASRSRASGERPGSSAWTFTSGAVRPPSTCRARR